MKEIVVGASGDAGASSGWTPVIHETPHVTASNHTPFIPANIGTFGARATGVVFFISIGGVRRQPQRFP